MNDSVDGAKLVGWLVGWLVGLFKPALDIMIKELTPHQYKSCLVIN